MCVPLVSHARTHARGRRRRSRERDPLDPVRPSLSLVASHGCWVAQDPLQKPRSHLTLAVAALLPSLAWKGSQDSVSPASFPPTSRRPVARGCLPAPCPCARPLPALRHSLAYGGALGGSPRPSTWPDGKRKPPPRRDTVSRPS